MTLQERKAMADLLDIIDYGDGVRISSLWKAVEAVIGFQAFIIAINELWYRGLIWVDARNIAHRVKS